MCIRDRYENEGTRSAVSKKMIFHSHTNKTHFHKKGCAPSLILKVRVFGTLKWPIAVTVVVAKAPYKHEGDDSENVT